MAELCRLNALKYYLPLRSETKVYQRRKVTVEKPVFPGYLFASYEQDSEGRLALLRTNNIVRVLDPGNERQLLRQLAQVRKALTVDITLAACSALKKGRLVRITGGAFLGIEGIVSDMKGTGKVLLNIDMIGRAVAVEVDRAFLEVID